MTDSINGNEVEPANAASTAGQELEHPVYVYGSSGISEREGHVPIWLWLVVVSLLIWGIYYLVAYWNAPP